MIEMDSLREMVREKERDKVHYITPLKLVLLDDVRYGAKIETCLLSESAGERIINAEYESEKDAIDAAKTKFVEDVVFDITEGSVINVFDFLPNYEATVLSNLDIRIQKTEIINKLTSCPECDSETVKVGTRAYVDGLYQIRRCKECGHAFRAEKII